MSLPSTKQLSKQECPECYEHSLSCVVVSETFNIDGQDVQVDGLMAKKCGLCGAMSWPVEELDAPRRSSPSSSRRLRPNA